MIYRNNKNIVNEGLLGVISLTIFGLPWLVIIAANTFLDIQNTVTLNKVKRKVKQKISEDIDIIKMEKDIKCIKSISFHKLMEEFNLSSSVIKKYKYNDIECLAMYNKKDKIIAYIIYDKNNNEYGYGIDPKYKGSKKISSYILALLELRSEVIGDGIKYFIDDEELKELIPKHSYLNNKKKEMISEGLFFNKNKGNTHPEEFKEALDQFIKLSKDLALLGKKIGRDSRVNSTVNENFTSITNSYNDSFNKGKNTQLDYSVIFEWVDEDDNGVTTFISNEASKFAKSHGFKDIDNNPSGAYAFALFSQSDKYPYMQIEFGYDTQLWITISSKRSFIKISESAGIFESVEII
jgi:hypothetical protein